MTETIQEVGKREKDVRSRLDFRRFLESGLRSSREGGERGGERGLISRTAAGYRAYVRRREKRTGAPLSFLKNRVALKKKKKKITQHNVPPKNTVNLPIVI